MEGLFVEFITFMTPGGADEATPLARAEAGHASTSSVTKGKTTAEKRGLLGETWGGVSAPRAGAGSLTGAAAFSLVLVLVLTLAFAGTTLPEAEGSGVLPAVATFLGVATYERVSLGKEEIPMMDKVNLCPEAFVEAKKLARVEDTKFSGTLAGVVQRANLVYVLCSEECDTLVIPDDWPAVTLVNGPVLDECNNMNADGMEHWQRVSRSHEAVMEHAFDGEREGEDVNVIAVLEEDTVGDTEVAWEQDKWYAFQAAFDRQDWNMFRMAYRPYDFEPGKEAGLGLPDAQCPEECKCHMYDTVLCFTHNSGCALQSADAYLMHRRTYEKASDMLRQGLIVDYHVFKQIGGQFLFKPPLSYQSRYAYVPDEITYNHSAEVMQVYMDKCAYRADDEWS